MALSDSPVGQVGGKGRVKSLTCSEVGWGKTYSIPPISSFLSLTDSSLPNQEKVTLYLPIGAELGWKLKLEAVPRADWQSLGPMASG